MLNSSLKSCDIAPKTNITHECDSEQRQWEEIAITRPHTSARGAEAGRLARVCN